MYEKLVPGDQVMKIPGKGSPGVFFGFEIENGSCGVVLEGEGELPYCDDLGVPYTDYGCYVNFTHYATSNEKGWFINRPRLIKISPNEPALNNKDIEKMYEMANSIASS